MLSETWMADTRIPKQVINYKTEIVVGRENNDQTLREVETALSPQHEE